MANKLNSVEIMEGVRKALQMNGLQVTEKPRKNTSISIKVLDDSFVISSQRRLPIDKKIKSNISPKKTYIMQPSIHIDQSVLGQYKTQKAEKNAQVRHLGPSLGKPLVVYASGGDDVVDEKVIIKAKKQTKDKIRANSSRFIYYRQTGYFLLRSETES